jgi:hypothetical protein
LSRDASGIESAVDIEVSREVDVERIAEALRERGYEPEAYDQGVRVPCEADECDALVSDLEAWVAESGVPLVPELADGHVYLRPPSG